MADNKIENEKKMTAEIKDSGVIIISGKQKEHQNEPPSKDLTSNAADNDTSTRKRDADADATVDTKRKKVVGVTTTTSSPNASVVTTTAESTHDKKQEPVVTPTSASAIAAPASASPSYDTQVLDLAETLGYKSGDRIEVQWEIHNTPGDDEEHEREDGKPTVSIVAEFTAATENSINNVATVWWKATLLEHDGRTTDDHVAIRSLLYDPQPELGFPQSSQEDVIFLGYDKLVSPHQFDDNDEPIELKYKREGYTEEENQVYTFNEDSLETELNNILMGALEKNSQTWKSMLPSQQAIIAEQIQQKKEQLKNALLEQMSDANTNTKKVITSETVSEILAKTFQ